MHSIRFGHAFCLAVILGITLCAQEGKKQWAVSVGGYIITSSPALSLDQRKIYVGVTTPMGTGGRVVEVTPDGGARILGRDFPDWIDCTPAVGADGTVYVGCYDGRLYALNPIDGARKWVIDTGTYVVSSPAVGVNGAVYFGAGDSRLHAVSREGAPLWTFEAEDWIDSSPAIGPDGTLYFGSRDKHLYAVSPQGDLRWRFPTGGRIDSSPAIEADGTIYFGSADQRLYAITPSGVKKWDFSANGSIFSSPVLGADGTVYFAADDAVFYALRSDGALQWKTPLNSGSVSTAAVRGDGAIIVGADNGTIRALNHLDGSELWLFDTTPKDGDGIESSAVVADDGSVYVGSLDGKLYKISGNGSPLSSYSNWPCFRGNSTRNGQAPLAVTGGGRLANLSSRAEVANDGRLITGFVVQGESERAYMIRGVGPGLAGFGVAGVLVDPKLDLFSGSTLKNSNDDWGVGGQFGIADTAAAVGAFPLLVGSKDAALIVALASGLYTAHVRGAEGSGIALVETYDALGGDLESRLVNLSIRAPAGTGERALIVGIVVGGQRPTKLLVRAIGPGLAAFGVSSPLSRPTLTVFRGKDPIKTNAFWTSAGYQHDLVVASERVGAFALAPNSADCALIFTAYPGDYTLQVSGFGNTSGEALAEVYVLP